MLEKLRKLAAKLFSSLEKEKTVLQTLDGEVRAAVQRLDEASPGVKEMLANAHGYAVFPSVGKAAAVLGGAFGKGEVFEQGKLIGYAAMAQLTIGLQLGGDTYTEVVAFQNKQALDAFQRGRTAFAANASAVLIKAGAATSADYQQGVAVLVHSEGGLMLEAAIGGQHFFFRPALMGRTKTAPTAKRRQTAKGESAHRPRSSSGTRRPARKSPDSTKPARPTRSSSRPRRKASAARGRPGK